MCNIVQVLGSYVLHDDIREISVCETHFQMNRNLELSLQISSLNRYDLLRQEYVREWCFYHSAICLNHSLPSSLT